MCKARLDERIDCNYVGMRWRKNDEIVVKNNRVTVISNKFNATLQSSVSFSPLLLPDSGTYRCEVTTKSSQRTCAKVMAFKDVPLTVIGT